MFKNKTMGSTTKMAVAVQIALDLHSHTSQSTKFTEFLKVISKTDGITLQSDNLVVTIT